MTIFASILILAAVLISTRIVSTALHIRKYVRSAKLSGLPYTWSFVHELGTVAFFTNAVLRWCYRDYLEQGKGWPKWARFMIKDWQYEDHRRATSEYGDTFLIITPTGLVCYTSDPSIVSRVMGRRKAFVKASDRIGETSFHAILCFLFAVFGVFHHWLPYDITFPSSGGGNILNFEEIFNNLKGLYLVAVYFSQNCL